jgi:hypothetical protein
MDALFNAWDRDGSGKVNYRELVQGLAKLAPCKSKQARGADSAAAATNAHAHACQHACPWAASC